MEPYNSAAAHSRAVMEGNLMMDVVIDVDSPQG